MSAVSRKQLIDAKTRRDSIRAAEEFTRYLNRRYGPIDIHAAGGDGSRSRKQFAKVMVDWNHIHFSNEDVKSVCGKPTVDTDTAIIYELGESGGGRWEFAIQAETIRAVRFIGPRSESAPRGELPAGGAPAQSPDDFEATEALREQYRDAETQESRAQAKAAFVQVLSERYSGIDASVTGRGAFEQAARFGKLMLEWNPIHFSVDDLKKIAGKPTVETRQLLEYHFDNGLDNSPWRFNTDGPTIVGVEYIPGD
ncbi:MAG: hypothetical protein WD847_16450 [Pirellulales bacterium]